MVYIEQLEILYVKSINFTITNLQRIAWPNSHTMTTKTWTERG